jgi:hypothetical protein
MAVSLPWAAGPPITHTLTSTVECR